MVHCHYIQITRTRSKSTERSVLPQSTGVNIVPRIEGRLSLYHNNTLDKEEEASVKLARGKKAKPDKVELVPYPRSELQ